MTTCLRESKLDFHYEGFGEFIAKSFVIPALRSSISYDRITSFFSTQSLVAVADGVQSLWQRQGQMRLILGIHDVPGDIANAATEAAWVDALVARARRRVIDEVAQLSDELDINRIGTLAMMMRDGFLAVRVGAPRGRAFAGNQGILHSKRMVFRDACGHVIVAIGSPNETGNALTRNIEELSVHRSWEDPQRIERLCVSFQRMWDNEREDVEVRELDTEFAEEILASLRSTRPQAPIGTANERRSDSRIGRLIQMMRTSAEFAFVNISRAALFPHQERALRDAASRTPIRVLLADEVGLGKTLEAGSVVAYARRFRGVQRVLLLTPAGLLRQWQTELDVHFGITAHRFDGSHGGFVGPDGSVIPVRSQNPLDDAPQTVLISWHLARGAWRTKEYFRSSRWQPQLVVVDEAHAARRRRAADGSHRTTQVWRLVNDIGARCPNLLLLTATPMQIELDEYHGLLKLLGMPEWWQDADNMRELLSQLAEVGGKRELAQVKRAADAVAAARGLYTDALRPVPANIRGTLERIGDVTPVPTASIVGLMNKVADVEALAVTHTPPALLTVRNTRGALQRLGYKFPRREFKTPGLEMNEPGKRYMRRLDAYLSGVHGTVERDLGLIKGSAVGFLRSIYYQRIVSSFSSALKTLERRHSKLSTLIETGVFDDRDLLGEVGDDGSEEDMEVGTLDRNRVEQAVQSAKVERQHVEQMLADLRASIVIGEDPKIKHLRDAVLECVDRGDAVLVFSRFTDTVEACIQALALGLESLDVGYGKYTGHEAWIRQGSRVSDVTKDQLRDALRKGKARVVFCSDAASEGLNLQTARVIINVDVPWNPSRIEQRIGRIARLGQRADVVEIHNLWYPSSIESTIYARLMSRLDLYDQAVGEFPDVIGEGIREALSQGRPWRTDADGELAALRNQEEMRALSRIWTPKDSKRSMGQSFRLALFRLVVDIARREGAIVREAIEEGATVEATLRVNGLEVDVCVREGEPESISLAHPCMSLIEHAGLTRTELLDDISILSTDGELICAVASESSRTIVLGPTETVDVLRAAIIGEDLARVALPQAMIEELTTEAVERALRAQFPNRIEPCEIILTHVASREEALSPSNGSTKGFRIRAIQDDEVSMSS